MLNSDLRLKWASSLPCCLHHELRTRGAIGGPGDQHLLVNKSCPVLVVSASTMTSDFTLVDRVWLEGLAVYFGDRDFGFTLIDRVPLEGLAIYLRRRRLCLRPRRQSSARGAHRLPSAMTTSPSPSSTEFGSRGSPSTFGDDDFAFALINRVRLEGLAIYLRR